MNDKPNENKNQWWEEFLKTSKLILNLKAFTIISTSLVSLYFIKMEVYPSGLSVGDGLFLMHLITISTLLGFSIIIISLLATFIIYYVLKLLYVLYISFWIILPWLKSRPEYCWYSCKWHFSHRYMYYILKNKQCTWSELWKKSKAKIEQEYKKHIICFALIIVGITIYKNPAIIDINSITKWISSLNNYTGSHTELFFLIIATLTISLFSFILILSTDNKQDNKQDNNKLSQNSIKFIRISLGGISFVLCFLAVIFNHKIFEMMHIRQMGITAQILDDKEFNRIKNLSESARCTNFILNSDKKLIHNVNILWSGAGANTWVGLPIQGKDNDILFSIESKHISPVINIPPTGISLPENEGSCWDLTEALSPLFQQSIKGNKDEVKQKLIDGNKDTKSIGMKKVFGKKFREYKGYKYHELSQPQVKLIDKEKKSYRYTHNFEMVNNEENRRKIAIQFDFSIKNITITNQATGKQK